MSIYISKHLKLSSAKASPFLYTLSLKSLMQKFYPLGNNPFLESSKLALNASCWGVGGRNYAMRNKNMTTSQKSHQCPFPSEDKTRCPKFTDVVRADDSTRLPQSPVLDLCSRHD